MSTESSTRDQELIRTLGETTERSTSEPDTTTPGEIIDSMARPCRSSRPCTNFAGGHVP